MTLRNDHLNTELTAAEQKALDIIANERAVVKVVSPDSEFILDQIVDPNNNRPSRSAHFYKSKFDMARPNKVLKFNPSALPNQSNNSHLDPLSTHDHEFGKCHERTHDEIHHTHTKKTAVSFIPSDPRYIRLFSSAGHVGLLWNIEKCDLIDERYLFGDGDSAPWIDTDWCDWLDVRLEQKPDPSEYDKSRSTLEDAKANHSTTVERFREINQLAVEQKNRLRFNEWLIGLPKQQVDAIFHVVDSIYSEHFEEYRDAPAARISTWEFMLKVKKKLDAVDNIPVLIISDVNPVRVYTESDYQADLKVKLSHESKPHSNAIGNFNLFTQYTDNRIPEHKEIIDALVKLKSVSLTDQMEREIRLALMKIIASGKKPLRLLKSVVPFMKRCGLDNIHMLFEDFSKNPHLLHRYCNDMKMLQNKFPDQHVYNMQSFKDDIDAAIQTLSSTTKL
ncbi:MAG TPA: hypothetical protein VL360_05370 [Gammaproteobacteria bacterium]|jgi:hypothetical protein|nr:hypothetical protein [Gammaproteobacteria bacterium]